MTRVIYLIFLIASILMYLNCPEGYSIEFCSLVAGLYVVQSLFYLSKVNRFGFLSFDLIFLFSFFLACFAFPVLFVNIDLSNFANINYNVINKSTVLCLVGANSYMIGGLLKLNSKKYEFNQNINFDQKTVKKNTNTLVILSYILFFLFIFGGGLDYVKAYDDINNPNLLDALAYLDLLKVIFVVCTLFVFLNISKKSRIKDLLSSINKYYLVLYVGLILILLAGGTRNLPIQFILIVLFLYNLFIKRISTISVLFMVMIGFLFFTMIRIGREDFSGGKSAFSGEISAAKMNDSSTFFSDFVGSSATLYTLVDESDVQGITYGKSMILPVLGVVPFLQSFSIAIFDLDIQQYSLTSSLVATDLIFNSRESGAGTNIIGDIYFSFGFSGVIICMFLLGYFITFLTNRIILNINLLALVSYLCLFSLSLFIVRVEFTFFIKYLVWSVMLLKILTYLNNKNKKVTIRN